MKAITVLVCTLTLAAAAVAGMPPVPTTPAPVDDLVYARSFSLNAGFTFNWCQERPEVSSGTLLVLKVNPDLVMPRQTAEPVLYVGAQTAQRINFGNESGYVVALVPGEVDLTKAPIWFGTPELPERITANRAQAELEKAVKAGIKPFTAKQISAAQAKGGAAVKAADQSTLLREQVVGLLREYSPQESQLADDLSLVPVTPVKK